MMPLRSLFQTNMMITENGWTAGNHAAGAALATTSRSVKLAAHGYDVDTSHFTGNYPPACSIEACWIDSEPPLRRRSCSSPERRARCRHSDALRFANRLLSPGGINMGDGWETRRRELDDWIIVQLGHDGQISRVVVDTAHYKGNYPDRCSLQARISARSPETWRNRLSHRRCSGQKFYRKRNSQWTRYTISVRVI